VNKAALFFKLFIVGIFSFIIVIALLFVMNVISDRQDYRDQARKQISASYATSQRVVGPVFIQPYRITTTTESVDEHGVKHKDVRTDDGTYSVFPAQLSIQGTLKPDIRRHGLYRVPVYEFSGSFVAHFNVPPPPLKGDVSYGIPYLAIAIQDSRGIVGTPAIQVNGAPIAVQSAELTTAEQDNPVHPGIPYGSNLRALLPQIPGQPGSLDAVITLSLDGTQDFSLVPLGGTNHFELSSPWPSPLFEGQFLPRTRNISSAGFTAAWDVSSLASGAQNQLTRGADHVDSISVSLSELIDPYSLANRATKYGILFVLLTFGGFFMFEVLRQMRIHPIQYLLVGFCLAVFFLLLVSISEHIPFGAAYLVSSVACIGLLTYYLVYVLKNRTYGLSFGAILTTLYAALYGLLISEDNALLLGSLLLFFIIAVMMLVTRRVDWYQRTRSRRLSRLERMGVPSSLRASGGASNRRTRRRRSAVRVR